MKTHLQRGYKFAKGIFQWTLKLQMDMFSLSVFCLFCVCSKALEKNKEFLRHCSPVLSSPPTSVASLCQTVHVYPASFAMEKHRESGQ